jgi:5-methylcytosine-specific restriction endonuclease McrA
MVKYQIRLLKGLRGLFVNKLLRGKVFNKTDRKCWYCGNPIDIKTFEVDHIQPIYRGQECDPELLLIDNLAPSCKPCNRFKTVFTVDEFREELELQVERGLKNSVNFRNANRFGLIKVINNPVVFYFERETL